MHKYLYALCFVLFLTAVSSAQTVKPTPEPTPVDDVVKISTNLIQVDVSVTDKNGKQIPDLKADEIEIYENGQKQKVTGFSYVSTVRNVEEKTTAKTTEKNAVPVPQRTLRPDQVRRTFALVVDDLSLSFRSAYDARRALKKFVDEQMQDGDVVAIIRTGAGVGALQQFTSDKRILYAAIEKVKYNPIGTGGLGAFAPIEGEADPGIGSDEIEAQLGGSELDNEAASNRNTVFASGTLGALQYVVRGMSELPGRKAVILFSDGFKLFDTDYAGVEGKGFVYNFMTKLVEEANRSAVVFYTIDVRGLVTTGYTAADNVTDISADAAIKSETDRQDELFDTQQGLAALAEGTGGIAFKNNNDISGVVKRALDDQSYYLVAYEPDSETFDPDKRRYNKLEVKVLRKGASVRYRSGFFNIADKENKTKTVAAAKTPIQSLQAALLSPFAVGGVGLHLNALFVNTKVGTFVRSLLHVDARDLKFTDEGNGMKKATFDIVAVSFGDTGQPIDQVAKSYTIHAKGETYQQMMKSGFVYQFTLPVKKPGAYQYRVAIRDSQVGTVGSASQFIEVPDLKKSGLTISGIVLESLSVADYQKISDPKGGVNTDPMGDTALRRIRMGSVLRYGYEVYNAKAASGAKPQITTRIRLFRDGKLLYDGQTKPADLGTQSDMQRIKVTGALSLGTKLEVGDYILQMVVTDPLAKDKHQVATQWVEFEVVE